MSKRAERLICLKVQNSVSYLYGKIGTAFASANANEHSEKDLRWYVWSEDQQDLSRDSNNHEGKLIFQQFIAFIVISIEI